MSRADIIASPPQRSDGSSETNMPSSGSGNHGYQEISEINECISRAQRPTSSNTPLMPWTVPTGDYTDLHENVVHIRNDPTYSYDSGRVRSTSVEAVVDDGGEGTCE